MVLSDSSTSVEADVIATWLRGNELRERYPDADPTLLPLEAHAIARGVVGRSDDPLILPVRVLWLPPERDGVRRARLSDLATLSNPRNPNRLMQKWIVRNAPDRHRVLIGEPARLSELRTRHLESNGATGPEAFARYIARTAVLALERAERSVIGDRYKIPRLVADEILDNTGFRAKLRDIAVRMGISEPEAVRRAQDCLHELVAVQSRLVTDLFTQAMAPFHKRAWTVDADQSGLENLREYNRRYPLVFLPSHRSYADPFVLGDVLAQNDFPPNHLMGGANLSFWPVGPIARRSGTVFIRRSFGDDEIYKAVVEEYFAYLLAKRFNLEWYFEGGRTRTGKLRPPKYGLMNYVADAVREGRAEDALLVPVSITYERLHELGAIASEQIGGAKKPEGLAWMARYVRSQQNAAGRVYVRFGQPLSVRERLLANGDVFPAAGVTQTEEDLARSRLAVQKLAFEVAVGINSVTPISANSLVTLALLGVSDRALTIPEIRAVIAPVLTYIELRRIPQGELSVLRTDSGLGGVLDQLAAAKVLTAYTGGEEAVYSIEPGQHLVAAFYRNSGIHWFVNRAVLELTILTATESGFTDPLRRGWHAALELRDLLKFEFFFPEREVFEQELTAEMLLIDPDWNDRRPTVDELLQLLADTGFLMAHRVLRSFFDAQLVVAERLVALGTAPVGDKKEFLDSCVAVGTQMLLQARLHSPESVSSELFSTALQLAANRNLVRAEDSDVLARRRQFADEIRAVEQRLAKAAALDESNRKDGRVAKDSDVAR
ncbi:glycerol-3-phosphate 1-O-acyltransferase [Skermania sp. ID1734]|nr:glycerol-3-phosphate 1-O-acyltransferase [Skermania sp. ID1734]